LVDVENVRSDGGILVLPDERFLNSILAGQQGTGEYLVRHQRSIFKLPPQ
jgi:hypothetical protein